MQSLRNMLRSSVPRKFRVCRKFVKIEWLEYVLKQVERFELV